MIADDKTLSIYVLIAFIRQWFYSNIDHALSGFLPSMNESIFDAILLFFRLQVITTTPKVEDKLRSLLHLQERKQKLKTRQMIAKSKSKGLSMNQSSLTTPSKRPRPPKTFQPDWILGRHKRKDIDDPLEALKCLMSSLSIKWDHIKLCSRDKLTQTAPENQWCITLWFYQMYLLIST